MSGNSYGNVVHYLKWTMSPPRVNRATDRTVDIVENMSRSGCRIFEILKAGGGEESNLGLHATKRGLSRGSSFGPNVKKPTAWGKGGGCPDSCPPGFAPA